MKQNEHEYGTAEFYAAQFSDVIADVGTGIKERDAQTAVAMMHGFELAITQWMDYHDECIKSYKQLHARFLGIARDDSGDSQEDLWGPFGELRQGDCQGDDLPDAG